MRMVLLLLAILLLSPLQAEAVNWCADANMAGAWLLDDSSGDAVDCTSNGKDLGVTGATPGQTGVFGDAYNFDGGDYLESSGNFGVSGGGNLSYGAWLDTSTVGGSNDHIFNIGVATANNMSHMIMINGNLKFGAWGFDNTGGDITVGAFVHVVVVYNGSNYKSYIAGVLDVTSSSYSSLNITDDDLDIGRYTGGGFNYIGDMDEPFIIETDLSITDINDILDNGLFQAEAGRTRRISVIN